MTNNDELALNLKAAAEMATPGEWERGDGKHGGELLVYCDDALGSAVCEATSTYNSIPKLQRINNLTFIATANPANILALLAERDADKNRIAELEALTAEQDKRLVSYASIATKNVSEARKVSVKLPNPISVLYRRDFNDSHRAIYAYPEAVVNDALSAAGIKLKVGE